MNSCAPARIQRSRKRGWRMPPNTVYVGRPSKWGNQFRRETPALSVKDFAESVDCFHKHEIQSELRGKNLCCWCPLDQPCHADVLLEIANS